MTTMSRTQQMTSATESASAAKRVQRPLWREAFAGVDWLALRFSDVYRCQGVPPGDGSPVVVVPGLFASDMTLIEMHSWLRRLGYRPYASEIGVNARCPNLSVDLLVRTVDRAFAETGRRVTLIGHSLGGLVARGAAMRCPAKVAQVITLGSPVNGLGVHPAVLAAAELIRGNCDCSCVAELQRPLPSGITQVCIYSEDDGVVDPETCRRADARNLGVVGTHVGLVFNPQVYRGVAAALAEGRDDVASHSVPALRLVTRSGGRRKFGASAGARAA
jgi:pimeloyl-ACP methyl ester carboxylesterase